MEISELIDPRRLKWTLYGSFMNLATIFCILWFHIEGFYNLPFDIKYILIYGFGMSLISIKNTKTKYQKLDVALSVQPLPCPYCKTTMLPSEHKCPECNAHLII